MSTQLTTLLNAVSSVGAGTSLDFSTDERYQGGSHSFEVSDTFVGSVQIQGSIDGGVTWHVLTTFTDGGGLFNVGGAYTDVRGNVTAYTSGSITLKVRYGRLQDLKTDLNTLLTRLSSARATLLDNLNRLDVAVSTVSASVQINDLIKQLRSEGRTVS